MMNWNSHCHYHQLHQEDRLVILGWYQNHNLHFEPGLLGPGPGVMSAKSGCNYSGKSVFLNTFIRYDEDFMTHPEDIGDRKD